MRKHEMASEEELTIPIKKDLAQNETEEPSETPIETPIEIPSESESPRVLTEKEEEKLDEMVKIFFPMFTKGTRVFTQNQRDTYRSLVVRVMEAQEKLERVKGHFAVLVVEHELVKRRYDLAKYEVEMMGDDASMSQVLERNMLNFLAQSSTHQMVELKMSSHTERPIRLPKYEEL